MPSQPNHDDAHLVGRTLRGDTRAFRELIDRYRNVVFGLSVSYVGDFDRAEDIAQEAFIRAYYRLGELKDWSRFGPWVRTIVANLCRMELRKPGTSVSMADVEYPAPEAKRPDRELERREAEDGVLNALSDLAEGPRQVLVLYYLEEMDLAKIARFLEISRGAAKVRLHRARKALREEMEQMTKRRLTSEKQRADFSEKIDLMEFGDLAKLTDDEVSALAGWMREHADERMSLVYALLPNDPVTRGVRERILEGLDDESRDSLLVNLKYASPAGEDRAKILYAAQRLQREGQIRPQTTEPAPPIPDGSVEITRFDDIPRLTDYEIQMFLRETDVVDLADAMVDEEDIPTNERVRANVSERVWEHLIVRQKHHPAGGSRHQAIREEIVNLIHRLQESGGIRPAP